MVKEYLLFKKENSYIQKSFSKIFLLMMLFWFCLSTPKILIKNLIMIEFFLDLSLFFGYLAIGYFLAVILNLISYKKIAEILFNSIVLLAIFILLFCTFNLKPANTHYYKNFIFWSESRKGAINLITGIIFSLATFFSAILLFKTAVQSKNKMVKQKAFFIAISILCIPLAAIVRFILFLKLNIFFATLFAFIFQTIAIPFMMFAIFIIKNREKNLLLTHKNE
ncbi:MAG: hypothetical protein ACP5H7_00105 [Minisyncoccia bacterium]